MNNKIKEFLKFILKGVVALAVIYFIAYYFDILVENIIEPMTKAAPAILVILIIIMLWLKMLERKKINIKNRRWKWQSVR